MTHRTRIRTANTGDVSMLARLIRDSFRDVATMFGLTRENCPRHPSNCADESIERDFSRGVVYYVMEAGGVPVGCAALEQADPGHCYLERLAVLPQMRRRGLGRALVDHVIAQARARDATRIGIGIIAAQTGLRSWYRRIGFVDGETKEFAHLPFLVAFMSYELRQPLMSGASNERDTGRDRMRIEYLRDGSPDCPLIRIYGNARESLLLLRRSFSLLAAGTVETIAIHDVHGFEPVGGCRLLASVGESDAGVTTEDEMNFTIRLSAPTWLNLAEKTTRLLDTCESSYHQWLDETSPISLLLTTNPDGNW